MVQTKSNTRRDPSLARDDRLFFVSPSRPAPRSSSEVGRERVGVRGLLPILLRPTIRLAELFPQIRLDKQI